MPVSTDPPPGLQRVVDFINTREISEASDALCTPAQLAAWLGVDAATAPDLAAAVSLREALRRVLIDRADERALAVLHRAAAPLRVGFTPAGATLHAEAAGAAGALAELLVPVHAAMADGTWARVKACAAGDCHWAFYDRSRNRSGRWCEMAECGNRAKVRAHRARRADG